MIKCTSTMIMSTAVIIKQSIWAIRPTRQSPIPIPMHFKHSSYLADGLACCWRTSLHCISVFKIFLFLYLCFLYCYCVYRIGTSLFPIFVFVCFLYVWSSLCCISVFLKFVCLCFLFGKGHYILFLRFSYLCFCVSHIC